MNLWRLQLTIQSHLSLTPVAQGLFAKQSVIVATKSIEYLTANNLASQQKTNTKINMRKSRDRYAIVFGTSIVVITFLLVLDIQSKLNLSGTYFPVPLDSDDIDFPKQHIQSELKSEERVELITDDDESKSMEHSEEIDTFTALKRHFGHQSV